MRSLGDIYVKSGELFIFIIEFYVDDDSSEFRLHKDVTNPAHIIGFLSQWKMYLDHMPDREGGEFYRGKKLDLTAFEKVGNSGTRAKRLLMK
jgi:hypothetical protein